ncbi:hypothetical protein KWI05_02310 [Enterobacter bugandensis]|nr:hypothetical protein [Enterobacter bugandensis]MCU6213931.1 hypothetical protein [Enterobacter bugandensis]
MKLMKVISIAALTVAAMSGVANAAISETQTWKMVDHRLENTSNGHKLCLTGVGLQQATMEECGSKPETQDIREVNFAINGTLILDQNPYYAYGQIDNKIYIVQNDAATNRWNHVHGQMITADHYGNEKCLDIEGGKNVPGAKLYIATCTR